MKSVPADTILSLIYELNDDGWMLSDLYQTAWEDWHCVIRRKRGITVAYGHATGPRSALIEAMDNRPEERHGRTTR